MRLLLPTGYLGRVGQDSKSGRYSKPGGRREIRQPHPGQLERTISLRSSQELALRGHALQIGATY